MTEPVLPYNDDHINTLCTRLGLGSPQRPLTRVYGGFHHQMWRLDTGQAAYAIKQLCSDTDVHNPVTVRHYNATEAIAEAFSRSGIPAVASLFAEGKHLQVVGRSGYLVYPWTEARALEADALDDEHALTVTALMAQMHLLNLDMPDSPDAQYDIQPQDQLVELIALAVDRGLSYSSELLRLEHEFLRALADGQAAVETLQRVAVISHGDLDHKNVLWDVDGNPLIIDWESARRLNPTHEIVLEALEWSGVTGDFSTARFGHMLSAYTAAGGKLETAFVEAAFRVVIVDWLNWLMYNLGRNLYMEGGEPGALGAEQVQVALGTIARVRRHMPDLLSVAIASSRESHSHV